MTNRTLGAIIFAISVCATCFGQRPFLGLRAGISTKPEVERVLGRPVKQVSRTLSEYPPRQLKLKAGKTINSGKIFVQYRDSSAAAVAERIELVVCVMTSHQDPCEILAFHYEFDPGPGVSDDGTLDAEKLNKEPNGSRFVRYFGAPRYMLRTDVRRDLEGQTVAEGRWAFYSRKLYESVAPTGDCIGTFWGTWETEWGRMTITRTDVGKFRATYAENNGTATGVTEGNRTLEGEWNDSTGNGTIWFKLLPLSKGLTLRGNWTRKTGNGPKEGTWEGRCVE